jgi:hypothetical protein
MCEGKSCSLRRAFTNTLRLKGEPPTPSIAVAETGGSLQKERQIAVCPTTHLQDDVCDSPSGADWSLERRSIPTIRADSPRITSKSLRISPYLLVT